ncbi:MAG: DUF131 domain-containing protein [Thermoplasmata archaeon]|nr:DUF131 domain-containing protein [Thermoplasmata archaeon]
MKNSHSTYCFLSILLFILGIPLLVVGAQQGNASGGLVLIIPFIVVSGLLPALGILLIFLGIVVFQFSIFHQAARRIPHVSESTNGHHYQKKEAYSKRGEGRGRESPGYLPLKNGKPIFSRADTKSSGKAKGGGIIFIGPIPIIFGDSMSMRYLLPCAIILFILMIIAGILF